MSAVPRIELVGPEPEPEHKTALERRVIEIKEKALGLVIETAEDFKAASEFLVRVKTALKEVDDTYDASIEAAHRSHKEALALKAKFAGPLLAAEKTVKPLMATYKDQEERKRLAEERRLQELAKKQAEEDQLQAALDAENAGDAEAALEIIAAPVQAPVVVVKSTTKAAGVSFRKVRKARVTSFKALVVAVAEGRVPLMALLPNQAHLDNQAAALGAEFAYPGVESYEETIVSGRG
ncbi:MAG: hypothetical protein Q8P41_31740 [Pseudomonadota bacterium]|nr:hypothetical protein [Pseudomonadota bacterium]